MPSPIVTTIGAANANSYVEVAAADIYLGDRLNATFWTGAVADDKTRALIQAANRLQIENWLGDRVTTTQRLAWPRIGVAKVDPAGGGYGLGYGGGYCFSDYYRSDEIPQPVKDAQCELALSLLANGAPPIPGTRRVKNFSADGLSVAYEYIGLPGVLSDEVLGLIAGLVAGNISMRG